MPTEYIYAADTYCEDCGEKIKAAMRADGTVDAMIADGADPDDEHTYDSGEYPKGPYDIGETDCPEHCADCREFLENDLTSEGMDYVRTTVREDIATGHLDSVAITEWMPYYDWIDYGNVGDCDDCGGLAELDDDDLCEECAEIADGPTDGDFTITPTGPLGGLSALGRVGGKFVGTFDCDDDAVREARRLMTVEQWWPNIWIVSDHGNWELYKGDSDNE
jgi:hypothetical protein